VADLTEWVNKSYSSQREEPQSDSAIIDQLNAFYSRYNPAKVGKEERVWQGCVKKYQENAATELEKSLMDKYGCNLSTFTNMTAHHNAGSALKLSGVHGFFDDPSSARSGRPRAQSFSNFFSSAPTPRTFTPRTLVPAAESPSLTQEVPQSDAAIIDRSPKYNTGSVLKLSADHGFFDESPSARSGSRTLSDYEAHTVSSSEGQRSPAHYNINLRGSRTLSDYEAHTVSSSEDQRSPAHYNIDLRGKPSASTQSFYTFSSAPTLRTFTPRTLTVPVAESPFLTQGEPQSDAATIDSANHGFFDEPSSARSGRTLSSSEDQTSPVARNFKTVLTLTGKLRKY
jgi:hypothetical protein